MKKNQSTRLTTQHKKPKGVVGIFGENTKQHDISVGDVEKATLIYNTCIKYLLF